MSMWTYVTGTIVVDTFGESDAESMFIAQTVVNHLPKITGSEGDVDYYLNLVRGYNYCTGFDEFGQESNLYDDYEYRDFHVQSCVIIALNGSLRDRMFKDTIMETQKMLNRLSSRMLVERCIVSVNGYDGSYIFNNPEWLIKNYNSDWVEKKGLGIGQ